MQIGIYRSFARFVRATAPDVLTLPTNFVEGLGYLCYFSLKQQVSGIESLAMTKMQIERKTKESSNGHEILGIRNGFESFEFEIVGGFDPEGDRISSSLNRALDDHHQKPHGVTYQILKEDLSLMFQRYAHICLRRVRDGDANREREERRRSPSHFI